MSVDRDEIIINGKFLLAPLEGMPRVGREIVLAIDTLMGEPGYDGPRFRLLAPRGGAGVLPLRHIPVEEVGRRQGFGWEQIDLPRHLRGRYSLNFTGTAPVLRRRGCVVVHDAQFRSTPASHAWRSRMLFGIVTPIVARAYRTVVTVSEHARRELADYGVTARHDMHVIPNGADHVLARVGDTAVLDRLGLAAGGYFLTNAYTHAHKNVRVLFDALNAAPGPEPKLVLFGSAGEQAWRDRGVAVPEGAVFAGRVSDGELVALMRHATAFLFPSTTEGFGLPPLEAMTLGCPTVCARAGAMPEVCGDGAWYAPPHDGAAWRALMERLADPAARTALAEAGRARAALYPWRGAARRYVDLLRAEVRR